VSKAWGREGAAQRKGAGRPPRRFELSGGALCLDFVNTVDKRPTPERQELLTGYADLVAWALQAGALTTRQAAALESEASRRPQEAQAILARARAIRETLFAILSATTAGRRLPARELDRLNPAIAASFERLRLSSGPGSGGRWAWVEDPAALDRMLWPVIRSTAELLTSPELSRVRQCASEACDWLFIDHSKNRSRRWCEMTVCGNRDKVRRHRERLRRRQR